MIAWTMAWLLAGCRKDTPAPPEPTSPPAPSASAPSNQIAQRVEDLRASFADASPETRQRVEAALQILHEEKPKEAIHALKLIDADSNLDAAQQNAIRELILSAQPRPATAPHQ